MDFVVYCDESRHERPTNHAYMAIGGLWVEREAKERISRQLRDLCQEERLNAEVKWSKVSSQRLTSYRRLVDFFFDRPQLRFRAVVVDHSEIGRVRSHSEDPELGFYTFYYQMLVGWLEPKQRYLILLDFKKNKGADRYTQLRASLRQKAVQTQAEILDLTVIDSTESRLGQLSDLLTGAVAASWCRALPDGGAKADLARYIAERCGARDLCFESADREHGKLAIVNLPLSHRGEAT